MLPILAGHSLDWCAQVPLLGLVENMSTYVCPACGHVDQIFGQDGGRRTAADLGVELLAQVC